MFREFMDVDSARDRLRDLRHRRNDAFGAALMLVVFTAGAVLAHITNLAVALAAGALAGALLGLATRQQRIHLLTRLVAQGDARSLPSVDRHARNLVSLPQRAKIATGVEKATSPNGVAVPARVALVRPQLRQIAVALRDPARPVEPHAVALTVVMLQEGPDSPLLNDRIAAAELERLVRAIQAGVKAA
jgi:hypothetical protein